ncbi:uncharacterized protein [Rutidosis leptorrhynchoides]|uniref:uncharacterized protein n=1 Tax=Rutidosis leptorrhynchoides TaxID=125765 RepID=UPI003A992666
MAKKQQFHPALTVSNIKNLIPITLELDNSMYNSWSRLFKIHCQAYDVLDHIIPPTSDSSSSTTTNTTPNPLWPRKFSTIRLDDFASVSAYCQQIKSLADQLMNVGDKVTEERMVLQLIAGLNDNFDTVGTYFTQMDKLPSFYEARSKLILEETRKQK